MKFKTWILFLFSSICFTFAGIINLIEKKYYIGILFIFSGCMYVYLSIINYKGINKSNEKSLSDTDLENMNNELKSLIAEGKKIQAIKKCRVVTGIGLQEAKEYVDLQVEKFQIK